MAVPELKKEMGQDQHRYVHMNLLVFRNAASNVLLPFILDLYSNGTIENMHKVRSMVFDLMIIRHNSMSFYSDTNALFIELKME